MINGKIKKAMIFDFMTPAFTIDWISTFDGTSNTRLVDLDKYDIVPKKEWVEKRVAELQRAKQRAVEYYDREIEKLESGVQKEGD